MFDMNFNQDSKYLTRKAGQEDEKYLTMEVCSAKYSTVSVVQ
jgi:hypothetical protein